MSSNFMAAVTVCSDFGALVIVKDALKTTLSEARLRAIMEAAVSYKGNREKVLWKLWRKGSLFMF